MNFYFILLIGNKGLMDKFAEQYVLKPRALQQED